MCPGRDEVGAMRALAQYSARDVMEAWAALKETRPLILHVTNAVACALQANVCLAVGASPLMSQFPEEIEELVRISQGFLVNLGTPTTAALTAVERGMEAASETGCLTLLDPVGYGASRFRVASTDGLLRRYSFSILKGNAGEISLLAKVGGSTRGVDVGTVGDLRSGVLQLAQRTGAIVCATGETDILSDGRSVIAVKGGSALLPGVSGSGCVAGTLTLSVSAACGDAALGTLCGLLAMGKASEHADRNTGRGTFVPCLLDALGFLTPDDFADAQSRWQEI